MIPKNLIIVGILFSSLRCDYSPENEKKKLPLNHLNQIQMKHKIIIDTSTSKEEIISLGKGLNLYSETFIVHEIRFFPDYSKTYTLEISQDSSQLKVVKYYTTNRFPLKKDSIISTRIKGIEEQDNNELISLFNATYFWNLNNYENDKIGCSDCNYYYFEASRDSINFPTKIYNSFFTNGIRGSFIELLHKIKDLDN